MKNLQGYCQVFSSFSQCILTTPGIFHAFFFISEKSVNKVGIVINSLSAIISHQNIAVVCRDLCEVVNYHTQSNIHFIFFYEFNLFLHF